MTGRDFFLPGDFFWVCAGRLVRSFTLVWGMVLATRSKSRLLGNKIMAFIYNARGAMQRPNRSTVSRNYQRAQMEPFCWCVFVGVLVQFDISTGITWSFMEFSEARDETLWTFNSSRMSLHQSRMALPKWPGTQIASSQKVKLISSKASSHWVSQKEQTCFITPHDDLDHPCNWSEPRPSWIPMMSSCHGFCFRLCLYLRFGNGNHELQVEATNSVRFATVACGLMRSDRLTQYIKHHQTTSFRMNWKLA